MRSFIAESGVEEVCLDYFADLVGESCTALTSLLVKLWQSDPLSRRPAEGSSPGGSHRSQPRLTPSVIEDVIATVRRPESADILAENWASTSF